ncbi:hypothetical protein HYT57_05690 [Candidatus Woesearchaeota archaeon]|nr:hypothetical protein [Candidatus Woesearchaeota archaeon]
MRKEVVVPLTALVFSAYSNQGYADLKDFLNKAKQKATETRDNTKNKLEETKKKAVEGAREGIRRGIDSGSEKLREQGRNLEEKAQEEYAIRKGNAQQFYQEKLDPVVQREKTKFQEDPIGYTEDLADKINEGRIKFVDIASDGVAQGFVDIRCKNGERLGSIIERELGIKEEYTKTGAKIAVVYLMGHNPDIIAKIPIIQDGQGRAYSIDDAQKIGLSAMVEKSKRLQGINTKLAYLYQQGRLQEATQEVKNFEKALNEINSYANSNEYARLVGNKDFEFGRLQRKPFSEMSLEEMINTALAPLGLKFDDKYFKGKLEEGAREIAQLVYYAIKESIEFAKGVVRLIEHEMEKK